MSGTAFEQMLDALLASYTGMDAYSHAFRAAIFDFADWATATSPTRMAALLWVDAALEAARQALFLTDAERTELATHQARVNALAILKLRLTAGDAGTQPDT
jgi:hypothetical protein